MASIKIFVPILLCLCFIITGIIGRYQNIILSFGTQCKKDSFEEIKRPLHIVSNRVKVNDSNSPKIWIYVSIGFAEGMSKWRHSVSQLLGFARVLNATFVEPCMYGGRLYSCDNIHNVTLSSVFADAEQYLYNMASSTSNSAGLMATDGEFKKFLEKHPNTTELKFCLSSRGCKVESYYKKPIPFLHNISKYAHGSGNLVLDISACGSNSFEVNGVETIKAEPPLNEFQSRHHKKVDEILHRANITDSNFAIIHWRGEKKGMDYKECAKEIIQSRSKMIQNAEDTSGNFFPFMLMSSLNEDFERMWGGAKRMAQNSNSSAKGSLQTLKEAGFLKLDYLMTEIEKQSLEDSGFLAVYELILAARSRRFTTCSPHDCRGHVCLKCNSPGGFSKYAVDYRKIHGNKSSDAYWP